MQHCPHCGERVDPGDAYCFECGTELTGTDETGSQPHDRDPGRSGQHRDQESESRGPTRDRTRQQTASREQGPDPGGTGQAPGTDRPRERAQGRSRQQETAEHGGVESLTTLWVATGLAVVGTVENLSAVVFADDIVELVENSGFVDNLSAQTVAIQGGVGVVLSLLVAGLCLYYYRQGYVDRRFFWALVGGGVAGFLFGNAISFLVLIVVGAYGLLVVLRRSPDSPDRG